MIRELNYSVIFIVFLLWRQSYACAADSNLNLKPGSNEARREESLKDQALKDFQQTDTQVIRSKGVVRYSDSGAIGNGANDDIDAIVATHAFANLYGLQVRADEEATYYIGGKDRTAIIQTNTDFTTAAFIIDDRNVENRNSSVFKVSSKLKPIRRTGITTLSKNQPNIGILFSIPHLVKVTNSNVKQYIRHGLNQNDGSAQTDAFLVNVNGDVFEETPIIWDFDQITEITAFPIDVSTLLVSGGHFTTIANSAEPKYSYYHRNISIRRSNVELRSLEHHVIGEGEYGAPYIGFIDIRDAANIKIVDTVLTGRKSYKTFGSKGKPVTMGSYDISVHQSLNVSLINCSQTNNINDRNFWGIMSSSYSKNLVLENCSLSRFDAHKGVTNVTIRNSTLGHMGIHVIGNGVLAVENTTIQGSSLIRLRPDYGSTWQGNIIIKNSIFRPASADRAGPSLFTGSNSGQHNFGYSCYMPERISIENLHIDDADYTEGYKGPTVFADFNPNMNDIQYIERHPYNKTKEITLKNVTTASGKPLRLSNNTFMFRAVKVNVE